MAGIKSNAYDVLVVKTDQILASTHFEVLLEDDPSLLQEVFL
jgi:hypothetical protein